MFQAKRILIACYITIMFLWLIRTFTFSQLPNSSTATTGRAISLTTYV